VRVLTVTFIGNLDTNAIVPIISIYAASLGASLEMAGLIVGFYSIVHIPSNILFGRIVDKIGRKIPLALGLAWDAFSIFLYSISRNPFQLLIARFSHGLGGGFVGPSSMSMMADAAPPERRGRMMALYGISIAFSVLIGFMMSGILVTRLGYGNLFNILLLLLVTAVFITLTISEPPFAARERTRISIEIRRIAELFARRKLLSSYIGIFCLYFTLGTLTVLVPLYMRGLGMTEFHVAMAFATFALLSIVIHYPSGILSDAFSPKVPALAGLITVTIVMSFLPSFSTFQILIVIMVLYGIGHGLIFPSLSSLVAEDTNLKDRGVATGTFYAILVAGVAVGAPLMASLASVFGIEAAIRMSALSTIFGAFILTLLLKKK